MSADIVERLRLQVSPLGLRDSNEDLMQEAADTIERLTKERDANARDGYQCGQKLADMEMRAEAAEAALAKARKANRDMNRRLTRAERFERALRARVETWARIATPSDDRFRHGIDFACRHIKREIWHFFKREDARAALAPAKQTGEKNA